jgi:hypothetical protein
MWGVAVNCPSSLSDRDTSVSMTGQRTTSDAGFKRGGGRAEEPIEIGALQPENDPWIGAELPCSHRERGDELAADRFRARRQARRQRAPHMFEAKCVAATMTGSRPAT